MRKARHKDGLLGKSLLRNSARNRPYGNFLVHKLYEKKHVKKGKWMKDPKAIQITVPKGVELIIDRLSRQATKPTLSEDVFGTPFWDENLKTGILRLLPNRRS